MKKDVKVGVFVATLVCGFAAILLGSGVVGRDSSTAPALRIEAEDTEGSELISDEIIEIESEVTLPDEDSAEEPLASADEDIEDDEDPYDTEFEDDDADIADDMDDDTLAVASITETTDENGNTTSTVTTTFEENPYAVDETAATPSAPTPASTPTLIPETATVTPTVDDEPELEPVYVVEEGENFYTIAIKLYGNQKHFIKLMRSNPGVDPKRIRKGDLLAVPEIEGATIKRELLTNPAKITDRSAPKVWLAEDVWHVVKKGETLGHISKKYYDNSIKWPHIVKANPGLTPKTLREKQKILIPALTEAWGQPNIVVPNESTPKSKTPRVYLEDDTTYVIDYGDTLQKISKKHYGVSSKWRHILKANSGLTAERLEPGARILIPALTE